MEQRDKHGIKYTSLKFYEAEDTKNVIQESTNSINKYVSLVTLTLQNALLSILMRVSRTQPKLFITTTAVMMTELMKLAYCLAVLFFHENGFQNTYNVLYKSVIINWKDTLKIFIPSLVYTVQNNLIYLGATHLDAATNQVLYQLKILTTAIFSVMMLKKRLHAKQWVALIILFFGVAMVQASQMSANPKIIAGRVQYPWLGFAAIFTACLLSGFAGVYFEMLLKGSELSIWVRNVQMSAFSLPCSLMAMIFFDRNTIIEEGFFYGYDKITWATIGLQAFGGILVAMVVKYADNILKGFATSLAIIFSCVLSYMFLDFEITVTFSFGALMVIMSVFLYNLKQGIPSELPSKPDKC